MGQKFTLKIEQVPRIEAYFQIQKSLKCLKGNKIHLQYFSSKCNALKFNTKFKQIYLLKGRLKMNKIIKIILQQFGSTMGKNVVSQ